MQQKRQAAKYNIAFYFVYNTSIQILYFKKKRKNQFTNRAFGMSATE